MRHTRRDVAVALVAAGLASATSCTSEGEPASPVSGSSSSSAATLRLDEIHLGDELASAMTGGGDHVLVVDGLHTAGAESAEAAGWITARDDPGVVRPVALSFLGPRSGVDVQWWDGEFVVTAGRCPEPASGDEDPTFLQRCGSTTWDVVAVDPTTATVRSVVGSLVLAPDAIVSLEAATPGELLVSAGARYFTITMSSARTRIDSPPPAPAKSPDSTVVCSSGDSFVALTPARLDDPEAAEPGPHPLGDHFRVALLNDGSWAATSIAPAPAPAPADEAAVLGCAGEGVVVQSLLRRTGGAHGAVPQAGVHILRPGEDGSLAWTDLPVDELPESANGARQFEVVDGRVSAAVLTEAPLQAHPASSELFVWDGSWTLVSTGLGEWAYYDRKALSDAVFVASDTRVLRIDDAGGGLAIGEYE